MTRFSIFLNEALIDIDDSDIKLLYKPLKEYVDLAQRYLKNPNDKDLMELKKLNLAIANGGNQTLVIQTLSSSVLKSPLAKTAHEINPINIQIGFPSFAFYQPSNKKISIGIQKGLIGALVVFNQHGFTWPAYQQKSLPNEFTEARIKATIQHELTHWIDDSIHNAHISKLLSLFTKAAEGNLPKNVVDKITKLNKKIDTHFVEINAYVNMISRYKKENSGDWDKITFEELTYKIPSLHLHYLKYGDEWKKIIKKRMAREGLLGKNMVNT